LLSDEALSTCCELVLGRLQVGQAVPELCRDFTQLARQPFVEAKAK
jgi:hypothetical protein